MKPVEFDAAETHQPDAGWHCVSLAGSVQFPVAWFEKPPGHSSPMHDTKTSRSACV